MSVCLQSPSSLAENNCTGSSLHPQVNILCQSEHEELHFTSCFILWLWHLFWFAQINSMTERVCLDAKHLIACDAICCLRNSGQAVPILPTIYIWLMYSSLGYLHFREVTLYTTSVKNSKSPEARAERTEAVRQTGASRRGPAGPPPCLQLSSQTP